MKTRDFSISKVPSKLTKKELRKSAFYVPQMMDAFLMSEHKNAHCGKSVRQTSDIYMLFNQQRLDKMTQQALVQHFDNISVTDSSLSSLRKKMTDSQLASFVKSRYIQSTSELLNWSNYLNSLAETELQTIKDSIPSVDAQPTEPAPAPAPTPSE